MGERVVKLLEEEQRVCCEGGHYPFDGIVGIDSRPLRDSSIDVDDLLNFL